MLYAEWHRPRGVGLAGAVHRTWAVAGKNDWQFSNPRIDTGARHRFLVETTTENAAFVYTVYLEQVMTTNK